MNIISISIMKNEADAIEIFIRHHMKFFNKMLIIDHNSTDSSVLIVKKLQDEGFNIELFFCNEVEFFPDLVINTHLEEYLTYNDVDWCFPLDVDEILIIDHDHTIENILNKYGNRKIIYIPWRTYVPTEEDDQCERNFLRRITYRLSKETVQFYKIAFPCGEFIKKKYRITAGNHSVVSSDKSMIIPAEISSELVIAHFPVRHIDQILCKVLSGWLAKLSKPNFKNGESYHWKNIFDKYLQSGILKYSELKNIAINYLGDVDDINNISIIKDPVTYEVEDNVHCSDLRYEVNPVKTALITAECISREFGKLRSQKKRRSTLKDRFLRIFRD